MERPEASVPHDARLGPIGSDLESACEHASPESGQDRRGDSSLARVPLDVLGGTECRTHESSAYPRFCEAEETISKLGVRVSMAAPLSRLTAGRAQEKARHEVSGLVER
jgi:hypothetical protein